MNDIDLSKVDTIPVPLDVYRDVVRPEWIDHNGHMNVAYYLLAFDNASGGIMRLAGLTRAYKARTNSATFVGDLHICYRREVREGDPLRVTSQLVECDQKRLHLWHEMYHGSEGFLVATMESVSLHIDMSVRRVAPMHPEVYARACAVRDAHAVLPRPKDLGRTIEVRRGPPPA